MKVTNGRCPRELNATLDCSHVYGGGVAVVNLADLTWLAGGGLGGPSESGEPAKVEGELVYSGTEPKVIVCGGTLS